MNNSSFFSVILQTVTIEFEKAPVFWHGKFSVVQRFLFSWQPNFGLG